MTQRNWGICKYDVTVSIKPNTGEYYTGIFLKKKMVLPALCLHAFSEVVQCCTVCQGLSVYRSSVVISTMAQYSIFFISPYCNVLGILDTVGCSDHPIGINQSSSTLEHNLRWGSDQEQRMPRPGS